MIDAIQSTAAIGIVLTVVALVHGAALTHLPEGVSPAEFYGGFYPTDEWVESLEPLPRDRRSNPQLTARLEGVDDQRLDAIKSRMAPAMHIEPDGLLGMVPRRNRIAGNQRVMPATTRQTAHIEGYGYLTWRPDKADELRDTEGRLVEPYKAFPPTGVLRITGPLGEVQEYPYHDTADGKRIYVQAEFMDAMRVRELSWYAEQLAILYHKTGDKAYAKRAAAIIYDFAIAVPHWPKVARGFHSGYEGKQRFRPVDEYTSYCGIWYDRYHVGLAKGPDQLARAYDLVQNAPVWDWLDERDPNSDARRTIDHDLLLYCAKDAIRYDIAYPQPESALSNYIPYQARGLTAIGAAIGIPELIHYGAWKVEQTTEKTLLVDGVFPEGPSYFNQHVVGMLNVLEAVEGYSDPPGFSSSIDGRRFDDLDARTQLPALARAARTLNSMRYPDGPYFTIDDTHVKNDDWSVPDPMPVDVQQPLLYPAYGHAVMARGANDRNAFQAHLNFTGNWGHDHKDMLNFILWGYTEELVCDIGYVHTYRPFAGWTMGHNLVVVDRLPQKQVNTTGRLLSWHPVTDGVQVVEASGDMVYDQCDTYRRMIAMIPLGEQDNLVFDVFTVAGGNVHEWTANGSGNFDQTLSASIPLSFMADSYADDGEPFTPPRHSEYMRQREAAGLPRWTLAEDEADPWYGVLRDVHRGDVDGPFTVTMAPAAADSAHPTVHLHMLEPHDGRLITTNAPACRRGAEDDMSLLDKYRMPKFFVRRDGEDLESRFVALWETVRDRDLVRSVEPIAADDDLVAYRITTTDGRTIRIFHSPDPTRTLRTANGVELKGRTAVSIDGEALYLYDATRFVDGDVIVNISDTHGLPLIEADQRRLVLEGTWADVPADESMVVTLTLDGDQHRPIPVNSIEQQGGRTILHRDDDVGFTYDPESQALTETYSPHRTMHGKAMMTLPNRAIIQWHDTGKPRIIATRAARFERR